MFYVQYLASLTLSCWTTPECPEMTIRPFKNAFFLFCFLFVFTCSWDFIYAEYVMAAGNHHRSIVWQVILYCISSDKYLHKL